MTLAPSTVALIRELRSGRDYELMRDARRLVHDILDRFGQVATPDEVERAARRILLALPSCVREKPKDRRLPTVAPSTVDALSAAPPAKGDG